MQYYNIQDINELLADKNNPIIIENNIIDWLVALRDTVEYNTRYSYYTALMTFYEVNDVILRKKKISRFLGQQSTRRHKDRAYERSFADFLPLLPTGSEIKVGIIDYIIKIVGGALTFGLLAIALRRKFERKYTR